MTRLFSALVPPPAVVAHLAGRLAGPRAAAPAGVRWTPERRWHVTLGFFGDLDEEAARSAWLRAAVTGRPAPRLRLAGGGTFPGVLWVGVLPATQADGVALAELAEAAGARAAGGGGAGPFRAHLTVAYRRRDESGGHAIAGLLGGYSGPWFTPREVLLVRSDPLAGERTYTTVGSAPLAPVAPGEPGTPTGGVERR